MRDLRKIQKLFCKPPAPIPSLQHGIFHLWVHIENGDQNINMLISEPRAILLTVAKEHSPAGCALKLLKQGAEFWYSLSFSCPFFFFLFPALFYNYIYLKLNFKGSVPKAVRCNFWWILKLYKTAHISPHEEQLVLRAEERERDWLYPSCQLCKNPIIINENLLFSLGTGKKKK